MTNTTLSLTTNLPASDDVREDVFARLYGEPLGKCPEDLFIPPEALQVFLESFEGPLDLLLYLIRRQQFDIFDIPMAELTEQYVRYVDLVRERHLDLAAAYLVMSATLMQIKSRLLLPARVNPETGEEEDPRATLMERLLVYEAVRREAAALAELPECGRDYFVAAVPLPVEPEPPAVAEPEDLRRAWIDIVGRRSLAAHHRITRQELSVRAHMGAVLRRLRPRSSLRFSELVEGSEGREHVAVWFLAILELAREGLVDLAQETPRGDIVIRAAENEADRLLFEEDGPR